MGALKNFNSQCRTYIINASTFMLFIFVIVVLLQVLTRNILKIALDWTSEVSLLCFVWSVFLGAACAVSERKHYVVDLDRKSVV